MLYVIHKNSEKHDEYETSNETLNSLKIRKIQKLITQIKTQKILHPEIPAGELIDELINLKKGRIEKDITGLSYIVEMDEDSFFIFKDFHDSYNYRTMRFASKSQNARYDKARNFDINRKGE